MKFVVHEAQFATALTCLGGKPYIASGAGWTGWTIYMDTGTRELVVTMPNSVESAGPVHVPLEQVVWYRRGINVPKAAPNSGWKDIDE